MARTWSAMTRIETSSPGVHAVGASGASGDRLEQGSEEVGVVVGALALHHGGEPLEAHAGVDAGRLGRGDERPSSSRSNCMKTRFQISSQRSHSQSTPGQLARGLVGAGDVLRPG